MFKKIQTLTIAFTIIMLSIGALAVPATHVFADSKTDICTGVGIATGSGAACSATDSAGLNPIIKSVVNILSLVVGVSAIIMIIIGGFKYVISGGDSSNINSAKNTILYALVGLVVAALAQVLVHFVLAKT